MIPSFLHRHELCALHNPSKVRPTCSRSYLPWQPSLSFLANTPHFDTLQRHVSSESYFLCSWYNSNDPIKYVYVLVFQVIENNQTVHLDRCCLRDRISTVVLSQAVSQSLTGLLDNTYPKRKEWIQGSL